MRIASFTSDVTPPIGHPLCGGWIAPAAEIVDRQLLHGVVIAPEGGEPIVLCAVDWCWIRGEAHVTWCERIAEAVGTQPNRVAVQCVHQHDALMADPAADRILQRLGLDLRTLRGPFFEDAMSRCAKAARAAGARLRRVTHLGRGHARVEKVACNRRVLGPDGRVKYWRGSFCKDEAARTQPEGLIDPWLRTVSFWDGEACLAALHYYATHPMSHYGRGGVSADFVGLARERLRAEQRIAHDYFTGCAGNIAAGKYNDGSPAMRPVLSERMYAGMKSAFDHTRRTPVESVSWAVYPLHLPMSRVFTRAFFEKHLHNPEGTAAERIKGAMGAAWWDWHETGRKIDLTALHIGDTHILHLPAESFIEYQLDAQHVLLSPSHAASASQPAATVPEEPRESDPFIAVAAYGDCGPAYIPLAEHYPQGGYEVTMAWVGPEAERVMKEGIRHVLRT